MRKSTLVWTAALIGATLFSPSAVSAAAATCNALSFPVYFESKSAAIDAASEAAIASALRPVTGCRVVAATLVGRGDAFGPGQNDRALAGRRAQAVADKLNQAGLARSALKVVDRPGQAAPSGILERRVTIHLERR